MSAPGNRNQATGFAVRQLVAAYLASEGFDVTAKPIAARISDALDFALVPDIRGLDGIHLDVKSRLRHRLSIDLDDAARGRDIADPNAVAAFVQHRAGREIADSYVVLTLGDFVRLVGGTPSTP